MVILAHLIRITLPSITIILFQHTNFRFHLTKLAFPKYRNSQNFKSNLHQNSLEDFIILFAPIVQPRLDGKVIYIKKQSILIIGQEVNVIHKRHLPPTFTFTDLPHHRTCRSAYGGFVLLHLTVCDKLFSAIPLRYVTSILLSDSVLSCEQRVPFRTSDYKRLSRQQSFTIALHDSVLPYRQPVSWVL